MSKIKKSTLVFVVALLVAGAVYLLTVQSPLQTNGMASVPGGTVTTTGTAQNKTGKTGAPIKADKPEEKSAGPATALENQNELEKILGGDGVVFGRVLDEDDKPIAGVPVSLWLHDYYMGYLAGIYTNTLDNGIFRFDSLKVPLSGYVIFVSCDKMPQRKYFHVSDSNNESDLGDITLISGTPITIRVQDKDGAPLENSTIFLLKHKNDLSGIARYFGTSWVAEKDGTSRVGLPPGYYELTVKCPGFVIARKNISVGSEPLEILFTLVRGAEISGRVIDDSGNPVASASICTRGGMYLSDAIGAESDENGCFILTGLFAGESYSLSAYHDCYERDFNWTPFPAGAKDAVLKLRASSYLLNCSLTDAETGKPIEYKYVQIQAGSSSSSGYTGKGGILIYLWTYSTTIHLICEGYASSEPIELTADPNGPKVISRKIALYRGNAVSGRVYSKETGAPLDGAFAEVGVENKNIRERTDEKGVFLIGGFEPGCANVTVSADGYVYFRKEVMISGNNAVLDIPLEKGLTLSGTVRNEKSEPVACAEIEVKLLSHDWNDSKSASTDSRGRFRISGLVKGDDYEISIGNGMYETMSAPFTAQGDAEKDFILLKGASITGVVMDVRGRPVPDASVYYYPAKEDGIDSDSGRQNTTYEGIFRFGGCTAGKSKIKVEKEGYAETEKEIILPESGNTDVEIALGMFGKISGRIVDEKGELIQDQYSEITLYPEVRDYYHGGSEFISTRTGEFELKCKPGRHYASVKTNGYMPENSDIIELTGDGATVNCTIIHKRGLSVSGCVVDDSGAPIPGASVYIRQNDYSYGDSCDENGWFKFTGLTEGKCYLTATEDGYYGEEIAVNAGDANIKYKMRRCGTIKILVRGYEKDANLNFSKKIVSKDYAKEFYGWVDAGKDVYEESGKYPAGEYTVTLRFDGFKGKVFENIAVVTDKTVELEVYLEPAE
jgi:protocatechuate 3,4-dioxygenase beta subunit